MEFNIKDAAPICYGDQIAEDCARNEEAKDARQARYDELYQEKWDSVPAYYSGSLLLEALSELAMGENEDDAIVAA